MKRHNFFVRLLDHAKLALSIEFQKTNAIAALQERPFSTWDVRLATRCWRIARTASTDARDARRKATSSTIALFCRSASAITRSQFGYKLFTRKVCSCSAGRRTWMSSTTCTRTSPVSSRIAFDRTITCRWSSCSNQAFACTTTSIESALRSPDSMQSTTESTVTCC